MKRGHILKNEKAVSPVIATVLLIGMVIVISSIVFFWFKGITQEAIVKFDKNIELVCDEIQFEADYSVEEGVLAISNIGNVPIYNMKLKISDGGDFETKDLNTLFTNWKSGGLNPGRFFSEDISSHITGSDSITLTPVLAGSSESGDRTHECSQSRYAQIINF
jgi:flagellin-like protein|tara:strand:- start:18 stop:506 length:489 start_codon:yes stop_codon:yes gene_type:complete